MLFRSKQRQIEGLLVDYRVQASLCVDQFREALTRYCTSPDRGRLRLDLSALHRAESAADDIRREIENMMYSRALFPESRGDVLGLLESMDSVPNQAELVIQTVMEEGLTIPEELHPRLFHLVAVCCRCVEAMFESVFKVFSDFTTAGTIVGKIDELESEADRIQSELIQQIFASGFADLDKVLLRDLTDHVAAISDLAERVGDRIRIIVAKRLV